MQAVQSGTVMGGTTVARLCALGVGLWMVGVVSAHVGAPVGMFAAGFTGVLLVATLPVAWLCVRLIGRLRGQLGWVEATALASMPALILDGVAFSWAPGFYSEWAGEQRRAAAWLLWFVGVALAIAAFKTARGSRVVPANRQFQQPEIEG